MILLTGGGTFAAEFSKQVVCDIVSVRNLSLPEIESLVTRYDVIIHNAANLKCDTFEEAVRDNFDLTRRIVDSVARVNPGASFFYFSSMSVLKTDSEYADITSMGNYAFSKYLGEIYCLKHSLKNLACIRFSTLFFADPERDGLSALIFNAVRHGQINLLNNGEARRDFLPIGVAVQYLQKLINANTAHRRIRNISSGRHYSFGEVASFIKTRVPSLVIQSKATNPIPPVLHCFSIKDLEDIGLIRFKLEDYIGEYIENLRQE